MNLTKFDGQCYTGLANLGNTCFLNSCLQVINHTYELNDLFDNIINTKKIKKNVLDSLILTEWIELKNLMWSNNGTVSPNKFVYNVQQLAKKKNKDIFTGWAQNDMSEFLLFVIDCMHNSISRGINMKIIGNIENSTDKMATECYEMLRSIYQKEYSEIMNLYYGIYVSIIVSKDGQTEHTVKPENFFILDLPIPDQETPSIYDCFNTFTSHEILEGENAWLNEKTGQKEDIQKYFTFWNFPKILVITFKRFSPCGQYKKQTKIDFPLESLDLSKYISGYNPKQYVYDLFGVCNHFGNVYGGHYTSFVLNSKKEWIHFNDTNVEIIKSQESVITPMAYCLFYRKKKNEL